MKLLHTADWHVGKTIRGHGRIQEHAAVFAEMVEIAQREQVDLVLVAGDLFETAAPSPEAEALVYRTLLQLAQTGAELAVISGNHDNAKRLEALAPVFEAANGIHMVTRPLPADRGGVREISLRSGEDVTLAMLPFVSKRGIVRAADLWDNAAFENSQLYAARIQAVIASLCDSFRTDTVNLLMAHTFVHGGQLGGGERAAHFIEDYAISTQVLPSTAGYVALGHVHRPQKIASGSVTHYSGSPLQLDFGEEDQAKQVNLVELEPGVPARVTAVPLSGGRPLRTLTGSLPQLEAIRDTLPEDAWLRVRVEEAARAGLADTVRELLGPGVVDVRIQGAGPAPAVPRIGETRIGRSPTELFSEYLTQQSVSDQRVLDAFADLLDADLGRAES